MTRRLPGVPALAVLLLLSAAPLRPDGPQKAGDKDADKVTFEDKFDSKLDKEWSWLHEEPKAWRMGKDGLEIQALRSLGRRSQERPGGAGA